MGGALPGAAWWGHGTCDAPVWWGAWPAAGTLAWSSWRIWGYRCSSSEPCGKTGGARDHENAPPIENITVLRWLYKEETFKISRLKSQHRFAHPLPYFGLFYNPFSPLYGPFVAIKSSATQGWPNEDKEKREIVFFMSCCWSVFIQSNS